MNLLDDLTLAYEFLADDPIETSIYYGQSILDMLSSKVSTATQALDKSHKARYSLSATPARKTTARSSQRHQVALSNSHARTATYNNSRAATQYTTRAQESSVRSRFRTDFKRPSLSVGPRTLIGAL